MTERIPPISHSGKLRGFVQVGPIWIYPSFPVNPSVALLA